MHVVLVVPGGVDRGGRERVIPALLWLIEDLATRHRVTVVALGQEEQAGAYPLLGATVVNVPPERKGPHRLARQIARGVRAAGVNGAPDVVHGFWASVSGLVAVAAARRWRVSGIVHVAGGELVALPEIGYGGGLGRGGRLIGRTVLRSADVITAASEWLAHQLADLGRSPDAIVPLGVDTSLFCPEPSRSAAHPQQQDGSPRLVHIASLNRVKDQTTLLHALARIRLAVPGVSLDIAGVDTLNGEIHRLAVDLGLGDIVRFHGFVPSDELPALYRGAALHVVASRHEAGPVAVVEAAACGVATIGTNVGHVADFAALRSPAAVAVPIGDSAALADAVIAALGDEVRRADMADRARGWALANDRHETARRFEELYAVSRAPRRG